MDTQGQAWNRYCGVRDLNRKSAESLKVDTYSVFNFYGKTAFDFSKLPEAVTKRVKKIICQGWSSTRGGNVPFYANQVCEFCPEPFSIGFICQKYMWMYLPTADAKEVLDSFRALAGIHDDLNPKYFELRAHKFGQTGIVYNGWSGYISGSVLKEVKMLVKPTFDKHRPQRDVALDFLEAGGQGEKVFAYYKRPRGPHR